MFDICLLRAENEQTRADGVEVDEARFFTLKELQSLPRLQFVSRMNIVPVLQGRTSVLRLYSDPFMPPGRGNLYAAEGIGEEHRRLLDILQRDQGRP